MLLRDFAKPVAIAFLLSVPIAYGLADHWLQDFAYRVEIGVALFMVSGALSFPHRRADGWRPGYASCPDQPRKTLHTK